MYINIELLDKWEAPPINQVSKEIHRLQSKIEEKETAHAKFR